MVPKRLKNFRAARKKNLIKSLWKAFDEGDCFNLVLTIFPFGNGQKC
jgi:hypothetical protein